MTRGERIAAEVAELFGEHVDGQTRAADARLVQWADRRAAADRDREERYAPTRARRQSDRRMKALRVRLACLACVRPFVREHRQQVTCSGACSQVRRRQLKRRARGLETPDERVARMTAEVRARAKMWRWRSAAGATYARRAA